MKSIDSIKVIKSGTFTKVLVLGALVVLALMLSVGTSSAGGPGGGGGPSTPDKGKPLPVDMPNQTQKKIDPFLTRELHKKQGKNVRALIMLSEQPKKPFNAKSAKSLANKTQKHIVANLTGVTDLEQHWVVNAVVGSLSEGQVNAMSVRSDVSMVWLDREIELLSPPITTSSSTLDYGDSKIRADELWNIGYEGDNITIAILDTGIDKTHPMLDDLDDNSSTNDPKVIAEKSFTGEGKTSDGHGHGTHVAGIAAGTRQILFGENITGVAPKALLVNGKVFTDGGQSYWSWVISGIEWAVDQDVDIISLSLGGFQDDGTGRDPASMAVTNAVSAGIVVTVAAGNSGSGEASITRPAIADGAIAVAASDSSDNIVSFSSRGPTGNGRIGIDVAAPGYDIWSSVPFSRYSLGYASKSGTSMATPHAAGAAALLLQANPNITPREVERALKNGANDLGYDLYEQGAGRLDVKSAYDQIKMGILVDDEWFAGVVYPGSYTKTFTIKNNNTTDVTVTISKSNMATTQDANAGDWITLSTTSLTVPAGSTATFDATMNVPSTAKGAYKGKITINTGVKNIVIPVSVNVMQEVVNTTSTALIGSVNEDIMSGYGDFIYYTLEVQSGVKKLNLFLNWTNLPNTDLDLYLFNPEGMWSAWSTSYTQFESIKVNKPEAGKWSVVVYAYLLKGSSETYTLTINATGKEDLEITNFTVDPDKIEKGMTATFVTNITNKKTTAQLVNEYITIYAITANGREEKDSLSSTNWIYPGENTLENVWNAWPSPGIYEATTQIYYYESESEVSEKTTSFYIWSNIQVISTDENGNEKNTYTQGDSVYVKATGLSPNTNYTIWIQKDPVKNKEKLKTEEDPSGSQEVVTTDSGGNLTNTLIWSNIVLPHASKYDIVLDKAGDGEGRYNAAYDGIDDMLISGFETVPEFTTMIVPSAIALLIVFLMFRKKIKK